MVIDNIMLSQFHVPLSSTKYYNDDIQSIVVILQVNVYEN